MPDFPASESNDTSGKRRLNISREKYFAVRRNTALAASIAFPVSCILLLPAFYDSENSGLWMGLSCTVIPAVLGLAIQGINVIRQLAQRKSAIRSMLNTNNDKWIDVEADKIRSELATFDLMRRISTATFITGFIILLTSLALRKSLFLMGTGIGISAIGAILLSVILVVEFSAKEYAYRLSRGMQ